MAGLTNSSRLILNGMFFLLQHIALNNQLFKGQTQFAQEVSIFHVNINSKSELLD